MEIFLPLRLALASEAPLSSSCPEISPFFQWRQCKYYEVTEASAWPLLGLIHCFNKVSSLGCFRYPLHQPAYPLSSVFRSSFVPAIPWMPLFLACFGAVWLGRRFVPPIGELNHWRRNQCEIVVREGVFCCAKENVAEGTRLFPPDEERSVGEIWSGSGHTNSGRRASRPRPSFPSTAFVFRPFSCLLTLWNRRKKRNSRALKPQ